MGSKQQQQKKKRRKIKKINRNIQKIQMKRENKTKNSTFNNISFKSIWIDTKKKERKKKKSNEKRMFKIYLTNGMKQKKHNLKRSHWQSSKQCCTLFNL